MVAINNSKSKKKLLSFLASFLVFGLIFSQFLIVVAPANAAAPLYVGYQGRLKDSAGTAITGTYSFTFRIYTALSGGVASWTETQPAISVDNGYFSVNLGDVTALTLDFSVPYWISTEVASDGEMSPRTQINSVPYSYTTAGVETRAAAPGSPTGGRMYYNSVDGKTYTYDAVGAAWKDVTAGATLLSAGTLASSTLRWSGAAWVEETSFLVDASGNVTADGSVGIGDTASASIKLAVKSTQTSGNITVIGAPSAVTLAGALTGLSMDLSTNYTATGFGVTGASVALPAVTNTGAGTYAYKGLAVTSGALIQNTGAGTDTWSGLDITMPNITQTTGSVTSTGIKITGGTVTSGTSYALTTDANAGNVGIGTTTPSSLLNVYKSDATTTDRFGLVKAESTFSGSGDLTNNIIFRALAENSSSGNLETNYGVYTQSINSGTGVITYNTGVQGNAKSTSTGNVTYNSGAWLEGYQYGNNTITANSGAVLRAYQGSTSAGTITSNYGLNVKASMNDTSSGAITDNYGIKVSGDVIRDSSTGTITNSYGIYIDQPTNASIAGGTLTNSYGLRIAGATTAPNKYALYIDSLANNYFGGDVGIGDTTPDYTLEVSIDSGDSTLGLSDPDVAHGMTDAVNTDVYAYLNPNSSTAGGLSLAGLSDTDAIGLALNGIIGAADPTDTVAAIVVSGSKKNGTTTQALGSAETVFEVANAGSQLFRILGNGNLGVGDATPVANLVVGADTTAGFANGAGDVYIQNDLEVDGAIYFTGNITDYAAVIDASPSWFLGSSATERFSIQTLYSTGGQGVDRVIFQSSTASATADAGELRFRVDDQTILEVDDNGLEFDGSDNRTINFDSTIAANTDGKSLTISAGPAGARSSAGNGQIGGSMVYTAQAGSAGFQAGDDGGNGGSHTFNLGIGGANGGGGLDVDGTQGVFKIAGAQSNVTAYLYNTATAVADTDIGTINFSGKNSTGGMIDYAFITALPINVTAGSEDGALDLGVYVDAAGTTATLLSLQVDSTVPETFMYVGAEGGIQATLRFNDAGDNTAGAISYILGQKAGNSTALGGYASGALVLATQDGSAAVSGVTNGGNAESLYIYPGVGGAGFGGGVAGSTGNIFLAYDNLASAAQGNVAIGTTDLDGTPAIGKLTVQGSTADGTTNALVLRDSGNANILTVDTNGNVGAVGTFDLEGYVSIGNELPLSANITTIIGRTFTSSSTATASQLKVVGTTTGAADSSSVFITDIAPTSTHTSGTTVLLASMRVLEPAITIDSGTITTATSLYIQNAPTEAVNNFALYSSTGNNYFGGNVAIGTTDLDGTPAIGKLTVQGSTADGTTNIFVGRDSGNVNVATIDTDGNLYVAANARFAAIASGASAGALHYTADGTLTTNTSDVRLKENIVDLSNSLDKVLKLRSVNFTWKSDPGLGTRVGFIAQEMEKVFPELVFTNQVDGYLGIDYESLTPILTRAIQEQELKISALSLGGSLQGNVGGNISADNLTVIKQVIFNEDTVGQAKILAGATEVKIEFKDKYQYQPIVTATPRGQTALDSDFRYSIMAESTSGFTIKLNRALLVDLEFNWQSFGSGNGKIFVSDGTTEEIEIVVEADEPVASSGGNISVVDNSGGASSGTVSQSDSSTSDPVSDSETAGEQNQADDSSSADAETATEAASGDTAVEGSTSSDATAGDSAATDSTSETAVDGNVSSDSTSSVVSDSTTSNTVASSEVAAGSSGGAVTE